MTKPLIVITGASSGIGAGAAKAFSEAGYPLALLARNLEAMKEMNLPNALCIETDVSDAIAVQQALRQAEQMFGPIGGLINNAGFSKGGDFTALSHEDHETMIAVNLNGVVNTIEWVLPGMRERRAGTIINVSSVADRSSRPNLPVYAATKAAVKSLSESLRAANAKYGIRICNIAPAKIKTPLLILANLNENDAIPVENMANILLWIYQQPPSICIRDLVVAPTSYEM